MDQRGIVTSGQTRCRALPDWRQTGRKSQMLMAARRCLKWALKQQFSVSRNGLRMPGTAGLRARVALSERKQLMEYRLSIFRNSLIASSQDRALIFPEVPRPSATPGIVPDLDATNVPPGGQFLAGLETESDEQVVPEVGRPVSDSPQAQFNYDE